MSDMLDSDATSIVDAYDATTETNVSGLSGSMLGGRRRRRRRTRGKKHTLKKARKVKSRKLKSRRAKRRRGKRSRRRRRGGSKGCVSGTSSFTVAGNTLGASESMLANPPSASLN